MSIFTPTEDSVTLNVTTTSQRIALSGARGARKALSVVNIGTYNQYVYVRFGDSSVTASAANGYVVSPHIEVTNILIAVRGGEKIIGIPHGVTHVAIIGSGDATIQVTEGDLISG